MNLPRRILSAVLVALIVSSLFPVSAFSATVADTVSVDDPRIAAVAASYGYTDEGMLMAQLAADNGISQKQAASLAAMVDTAITSGNPLLSMPVAQFAGLVSAAHNSMVRQDKWGSFAAAVDSSVEVGGDLFLNAGGFWDAFGFDSLADARSFPTTTVAGITYSSGAATTDLRMGTLRKHPAQGSLTATQYAQMESYAYDPGSALKFSATDVAMYSSSDMEKIYMPSATAWKWMCSNCGQKGTISSVSSVFVIWYGTSAGTYQWPNGSMHECAIPVPSEAAYSLTLAVDQGVLPTVLKIASAAILNPSYALASFADAYGIPGVLPPGAVHQSLNAGQQLGQSIRDKAVAVQQAALDALPGFKEVLNALGSLMTWVADFVDGIQSMFISMLLPSPDYLSITLPDDVDSLRDFFIHETAASVFYQVADLLDGMSSSVSGSGSMLAFVLHFPGGGSYTADFRESVVHPLAPYRGYFAGALWLAFVLFLYRSFRMTPRLFRGGGHL